MQKTTWLAIKPSLTLHHSQYYYSTQISITVVLGGLVVRVLAFGPKVRGFIPTEDNGLSRVIKISSTNSFAGGVKPEVPCRKILRHVLDLRSMKEILRKTKFIISFASSSCIVTRWLLVGLRESSLWWTNQEFSSADIIPWFFILN
jgi:hypothetical protein